MTWSVKPARSTSRKFSRLFEAVVANAAKWSLPSWVHPERGEGVALVLPEVSTAAMDIFLAELSRAIPAASHAALVLDRAGRHVSGDLAVPADPTLVPLPPYSPELNPVERVWEYLRDRWLSHRVLAGGYAAVLEAACA